jgi:hypothetical protein
VREINDGETLRNAAIVSRRRAANGAKQGQEKKASRQMGLAFVAVKAEDADLASSEGVNGRWKDGHMEVPADKCSIERARIHSFRP